MPDATRIDETLADWITLACSLIEEKVDAELGISILCAIAQSKTSADIGINLVQSFHSSDEELLERAQKVELAHWRGIDGETKDVQEYALLWVGREPMAEDTVISRHTQFWQWLLPGSGRRVVATLTHLAQRRDESPVEGITIVSQVDATHARSPSRRHVQGDRHAMLGESESGQAFNLGNREGGAVHPFGRARRRLRGRNATGGIVLPIQEVQHCLRIIFGAAGIQCRLVVGVGGIQARTRSESSLDFRHQPSPPPCPRTSPAHRGSSRWIYRADILAL